MVATIRPVAVAIGAAKGYMASHSKTSQHFAQLVGRFSTATKTRWNSFASLHNDLGIPAVLNLRPNFQLRFLSLKTHFQTFPLEITPLCAAQRP
jgi:hypothetical protein